MGYASLGKRDSQDYICAIGHLDVVPVGEGWKHPPFSAYEENGYIYSRGILDNKGPILSCLYALYALKELGYKPRHEIRIIFGCNEETAFNDLKYYLTKEIPPIAGFTPDCKYPVVYAERGRALIHFHASSTHDLFDFMNKYILNADHTGIKRGIDYYSQKFGQLETRNYQLLDNNIFELAVSYPSGITIDKIISLLQEKINLAVELISNYDSVYFNKDSKMVTIMKETYEDVTGNDGTPVTTTGGTYAKIMPHIVPFGPSFPGQKGIGHNPNEWMRIEDIITNAKIYALNLYRLSEEK